MAFEDVATSLGLSEEQVNAIPQELREDKTLEPIKDLPGLITSHRDVQKMVGGRIAIPKEGDEKGWGDLFTKLGRPESPDHYQVTLNKPDVVDWNEDFVKAFKGTAHKLGVSNKQLQGLLDGYAEIIVQGNIQRKEAFDKAVSELRGEWGGAFERNAAIVKRLVMQFGGEELKDFFNINNAVGNDPRVSRFLVKLADVLEEGGLLEGGETGEIVGAEDAKAQIAAILSNPEDLYHAKFAGMRGHKERVAEVEKLYAIAYNMVR